VRHYGSSKKSNFHRLQVTIYRSEISQLRIVTVASVGESYGRLIANEVRRLHDVRLPAWQEPASPQGKLAFARSQLPYLAHYFSIACTFGDASLAEATHYDA